MLDISIPQIMKFSYWFSIFIYNICNNNSYFGINKLSFNFTCFFIGALVTCRVRKTSGSPRTVFCDLRVGACARENLSYRTAARIEIAPCRRN